MILSVTGWVVLEAVIGARLSQSYPLMQIVWCRYAVHLAILIALFGVARPSRLWRTARPGLQVARSLLMVVMPASFALALFSGLPPGTVWAVTWTAPLFALLLAAFPYGERVPAAAWCACAAGLLGALASVPDRGTLASPAILIALLVGASFGFYVTLTRRLRGEPLPANLFYTAAGPFVVLTPLVLAQWVTPTPRDALLLAGIGAVGLVTLLGLDRSTAAAPVSKVAPLLLLQLPVLLAIHAIVDGTTPSRATVAGVALASVAAVAAWILVPAPRERVGETVPGGTA
jgi:drug/metabolite transporter (DMT)-like permease